MVNVRPRIKEWLAIRGKSGKELAEHLGVSGGMVSEWCKGKGYPRFEMLWNIAKFLEVKLDDLYEEIN